MIEIKKNLVDKFQEHLDDQYAKYCARHELPPTDHQLVGYMIDQSLISPTHLLRYTVLREYERLNAEKPCGKTLAVELIASRFGLSTRTVWGVLKGGGK
jgi:hypothetical protein